MATRWLSEAHVEHVSAILKARMAENVTQSVASVSASEASEAELVTSVSRDMQLLMVPANVSVRLFNAV